MLETTNFGANGTIGIYPSGQRFGYKLKTSEGATYYTDPQMNPDKAKHSSLINLSSGKVWIIWYGITSKYSSDVTIEVSSTPVSSDEGNVANWKPQVRQSIPVSSNEKNVSKKEPQVRQSIMRTKIGNQVVRATGNSQATNNIKIVSN